MVRLWKSKEGSAIILLSMVFLMLVSMVALAVSIARKRTVDSWARVNAELWTKAILSEYDRFLLDDYGLMAFQGNDSDIEKKIAAYEHYSFEDKLRIKFGKTNVNLNEYRMSEVENFRKALKLSFRSDAIRNLTKNNHRINREISEISNTGGELIFGYREIKNNVVIDTLPSRGQNFNIDFKSIEEFLNNNLLKDGITDAIINKFVEIQFLTMHMGSHLKKVDNSTFFANEYEYVLKGKMNDNKNFELCKRDVFIIRNALNLFSLSKDKEKMEAIIAISEIISPGPTALITQGLIMESWAALEAKEDVKSLLNNERIPFIKTKSTWKTSLQNAIKNDSVFGKLSEDERRNYNDNYEKINEFESKNISKEITEGQNYEDYLLLMMMKLPKDIRTKRVMDLIQINMKYRHYDDFNFEEYNCGVGFNLNVNGKLYEVNKSYK